jgi:hypothetical protein
VSFASGAFLAGAIAGGALAAAVGEFRQQTIVAARLAAVLKATGDSAGLTAEQIDVLAKRQLNLTGIDDELIKSEAAVLATFRSVRNEVGQGNQIFTRAVKDVQDISSVFGTALTGSALQLGKALQDPIRGVTALRRSGITLSQSQRELIKRLVETGRLLTAQKVILGEVERQVGGTAAAIGQTLPGKLDILRERAKNALGEYVKRVSESKSATQDFSNVMSGLRAAFTDVFGIVRTGAGAFLGLTKAIADITGFGSAVQALGGLKEHVRTVTIAALAFGGLKAALGLSTFAQGLYARATTVATAATVAEGAAVAATSTRIGLGAAALGALRGPLGIALGITALTIGFIKLRQSAANAPGSLNATKKALDALSNSVERANKLQSQLAGRREDVSLANFNVQAAQRDVTQARGAQARSIAAPGSIEDVHLTNAVTAAEQKLVQANKDLATAQRQADITAGQLAANERSRQFVIANTTKALQTQIAALSVRTEIERVTGRTGDTSGAPQLGKATSQLKAFTDLMDKLAKSGTPLERQVGGALRTIRTVLDQIPTQKQIALVVKLTGQGMTTNQTLAALGIGREAGTEQTRVAGLAAAPSPSAAQEQQFLAAKALLNTEKERLNTLRETAAKQNEALQTQKQAVSAGKDAVASAREGLAAALEGLASARQALTDTIQSARQAVNQAVTDAKANLDSLGQSVADALTKFSEAGGKALGSGKLGKNFQALKDQILAGGGGPETQRAAAQIAFKLSSSSNIDTSKLSQGFADLTDKLNRGKITLPQFNKQLAALLKGLDLGAFRKQFGTAAANLLRDEIATLRKQARLILTGPQRAGGGTVQTLVRPLQAVAAGAKAIATAQTDVIKARAAVVKADDNLADAIRALHTAQVKETRANTAATKANSREIAQLVAVLKAQQKLSGPKQKPKGDAGKTAGDLTGAGAGAP